MTEWESLTDEFKAQLKAVTGRRARVVIDHILEHGHITTEELKDTYGYNHPPRAARDVREQGVPLETFKVTGSDGRRIGAYRFDLDSVVDARKQGGRRTWSKNIREELIKTQGSKCIICFGKYESNYLQIDHRVPYEVSGDVEEASSSDLMLLCASCNRAKSWSCEHCQNWQQDHRTSVCQSCYWASPDDYKHVAMKRIRRLDLTWTEEEISDYEQLAIQLRRDREDMSDFIKFALRDSTQKSK